jgi:Copper chaperone
MTKTLHIGGMSCSHCSGRVERALNGIPGIRATVDLAKKTATVTSDADIDDSALTRAVEDAGYTVEA